MDVSYDMYLPNQEKYAQRQSTSKSKSLEEEAPSPPPPVSGVDYSEYVSYLVIFLASSALLFIVLILLNPAIVGSEGAFDNETEITSASVGKCLGLAVVGGALATLVPVGVEKIYPWFKKTMGWEK
jgi:hypothetical protein